MKSVTNKSICIALAGALSIGLLPACGQKKEEKKTSVLESGQDQLNLENTGFYVNPATISEEIEVVDDRQYSIAKQISPCEDLHAHVCKDLEDNFKLPKGQDIYIFSLFDAAKRIGEKRKELVKSLMADRTGSDPLATMMQNYANSCNNVAGRTQEEAQYIQLTKEKVAKFKTQDEILEQLAKQIVSIHYSLVSFNPVKNKKDPRIADVSIDFSHMFTLGDKEMYAYGEMFDSYTRMVEVFFESVGYSKEEAKTKAARLANFEKEVANLHLTREERAAKTETDAFVERAQLVSQYPLFKLENLFAKLPPSTKIQNYYPEQLAAFHEKLKSTDLETLQDLLLYHTLENQLYFSVKDYLAFQQFFMFRFLGKMVQVPSVEQVCGGEMKDLFERNIDQRGMKELFPNFDRRPVDQMIAKIKNKLIERIKKNDWITDEGRKGALLKLEKMDFQAVRPLDEKDWEALPNTELDPNRYILNKLKVQTVRLNGMLSEVERENTKKWFMSPLEVNAAYNPAGNQFIIPMGILQPPVFDPKAPEHVNLGSIGAVIGHEIGHSLDKGIDFDELGRHRKWLPLVDQQRFEKNGNALKKFFDGYETDGDLTIGENIADLSGLSVAYDVAFENGGSKEQKQEFFKQWGKLWCTKMTPEKRRIMLVRDSHAQTPARINVPTSQIKGYQEAFNCKPGDKAFIADDQRVKIW